MKKNKLFLIGLVTVFVALLSLTLVSSTFARYVTTGEGTATARVAKWGVTIEGAGDDAFANEYETDDATVKTTIAKSVVSSNTAEKVVAPGTNGTFAAITVKGTPEVAVNVKQEVEVTLEGWTVKNTDGDDEFYCPIVFTVKKGTTVVKIKQDATNDTLDKLTTAIKNAIKVSDNFAPNTKLDENFASVTVSWEWAFDTNDAKDTQLGNLGAAPTISIKITTTVTQID